MTGATATLGTPQTGDRLAFTAVAGSGITGSYDATTGVLTLTGTSSVANYQTALRSVTFASVTDAPAATRTVGFEVTDGVLPSAAATKTIAVTALNDAPTVAKSPDAMSYIEQQGAAVVDASVTVSDPDSPLLKGATATLAAPQTGMHWPSPPCRQRYQGQLQRHHRGAHAHGHLECRQLPGSAAVGHVRVGRPSARDR